MEHVRVACAFLRCWAKRLTPIAVLAACAAPAFAGYPDRPIRLIVAYPPDGTGDLVGRVVTCFLMPMSVRIISEPVEDKVRPRSTWHGCISLQHTVAEALVRGRMDKDAYAPSSLGEPVINAVADKVRYMPDPAMGADRRRSGSTVSVTLTDGRELTHAITDMPGTRANPISVADYLAKFRANVDGVVLSAPAEEGI